MAKEKEEEIPSSSTAQNQLGKEIATDEPERGRGERAQCLLRDRLRIGERIYSLAKLTKGGSPDE